MLGHFSACAMRNQCIPGPIFSPPRKKKWPGNKAEHTHVAAIAA